MNKHNLSNASNKRRSNHKPSQSSSASLSKRPVLGRTDSSNLYKNNHDENSNIETTSIATIENNNNPNHIIHNNNINYDVSCICGKPLIRVTLSESYSDEPSVCCNMCFMIYRNPKDVIYICELRKTTQFHNNGYGFCQSCAAKLSKDEEETINTSGAQLIKNRLNGTISMLESDGNKHEFLPFMDRMSWFERVGLEYLAKQHMTDDEMKEMKDKLQTIKDTVIERAFGHLKSKIVEIDTMVTRLQEIQMRGNTKLLREYNIKIRIHRRQLLRIQNESSGKYRNQSELLSKLSRMRYCINQQTSEQIASCVCGEELFAMSVQECNYSDSWWCSHCCETYYKHDMLYHCENGKKCIYNELMQYIYDLCENCWNRLKLKSYDHNIEIMEEKHQGDNDGVDGIHLMIRKRLWESLQILQYCITSAHTNITRNMVVSGRNDDLEVMDKLAKRICNFETQFVKLKTCLEDEEREKCSSKMQDLVNILKDHLSLCLCGDIMIKLKATNYYCAHCFQTFKGKERVITFCRRRDKCKFYQNGYRLCEHCSNELMKEKIEHKNTHIPNHNNTYIISTGTPPQAYVDEQKHTPQQNTQNQVQSTTTSNTNTHNSSSTNIINHHHHNTEEKDEKKKDIDWTVCCRIEQRLQQSIQILEQSATQDMIINHKNDDKTQWNEHWNDWISRCNQFSSCLNKTKEHLHSGQFNTITCEFEIVKKNAVQRTLKQTNESITEISNALHKVHLVREYKKLNANVTEFRRQLLKMKRHGQESDVDIDNQLCRLKFIRDGINEETGERITTCICGEELFRRKASECYGNNYWCNRCFKTYSKDTFLYHCEVHKECEYHQFGYDLCEECAMELRGEDMGTYGDNILRIVNRLRASLKILYLDVSNAKREEQHKDDMAKRVDNFEMQYDPLVKWLSVEYLSEMNSKLQEICSLIKPYLPLCLCGSWFKHGSCDNAFICRCCSKSYEKGVETYYCKNTENCLYWKHGYNLCETCALTYRDVKHKKSRLHDRIIHRLWNSINHIWNSIRLQEYEDNNEWDALVLRYDNCEQYIQKCTYTHWLYNILSVHACLDNQECFNMRQSLQKLGELFKSHVPVCFCGDVFIYVQSPYELDCKHCFRELKENDKTYFCKSRDDCQHWNNSYYLCEDCVKELRKQKNKQKHTFITPKTRIKQRLQRSVQILTESINELISKHDNDGKKWLKMAYKVDQCKQHSEKLLTDFNDDTWCTQYDTQFATLVSSVKIRVPLCLCGAFFVHETSPIDFRCRHCFKLYDSDIVVIHYCQQQRDCQHFNSDYYLCNTCAMSLRLSDAENERMADRAYARLMKSIQIINSAVDNIHDCDWKDVSVRVYFYEQQLERLQSHLSTEENGDIEQKLHKTLLLMKAHLATCLCGNLFVSGPSPIDYECRSCFHQCRVEDNIYVCKSKQKCQHWRNHYYICDECSILLRKDDNNVSEELRIVNRLRGAVGFIESEFNEDILLNECKNEDRSVELDVFNRYLHRLNSFDTNFLSQMTRHLTRVQFEEIKEEYALLKSYILGISCGYIDERYRDKLSCGLLIFGFIHELQGWVCDNEYQIFAAVPEYVFHVCLDYYFQIHPQMFVVSMAKSVFRSLPLKYDNIEVVDLNHGKSSNLSFYDMKSFNKCRHSCQKRVINITKVRQKSNVKDKSWNKKECAFTVACNVSIPKFIRRIKPSLFDMNDHYDVIFKCGGYGHNNNQNQNQNNNNKQYTDEAVALIIDCHNFNHHYTDHYAFKSRHIGWKAQLKLKQNHKSVINNKNYNGYSLHLPSLPQKKRCEILWDCYRKQLLAYCDNMFDIFSLQFNDDLHSENEWKWNRFGHGMRWSRTRPSLMCTDKLLFIVGDIQGHHAKYAEIYSFSAGKWMETECVPYIAHNGCLFSDNINENVYYIGGQERNCGYYDLYKHKWYEMGVKTKYIYRQNNSCIWNSLENECKQILWIANSTNCEFYDERDNVQKWQIFPNINDNQTHLKLQNYLNIKYDSTNCDYTLLCRI